VARADPEAASGPLTNLLHAQNKAAKADTKLAEDSKEADNKFTGKIGKVTIEVK
jgi:hypothetical protein